MTVCQRKTQEQPGLSEAAAVATLTQATIGIGVFSLPYATAQIGILPSALGTLVIAVMSAAGIYVGVDSVRLHAGHGPAELQTLVNNVRASVGESPSGLGFLSDLCGDLFGPAMRVVCGACILCGQLVGAAACIGVVADTAVRLLGLVTVAAC
mmetsp:Transcript_89676/g.178304  ORF Transcript_89676/g.178304 Transcript_89676/m.178304 type:complete len:153 (+) Transcript_89676:44-502(+)